MLIGCDIIRCSRIGAALERTERFATEVFTAKERAYIAKKGTSSAAGIFAAKEAFAKAVGTGLRPPLCYQGIEVVHDQLGKPYLSLSGTTARTWSHYIFQLTIAHEKETAIAVVLGHKRSTCITYFFYLFLLLGFFLLPFLRKKVGF